MSEELLTIKVTRRQLTLIRVACLQRLDRLKNVPNSIAEEMHESYLETRAMLDKGGPLELPPR